MSEVLMTRSSDMGDENNANPITSVIIVADKNRCPRGFAPVFCYTLLKFTFPNLYISFKRNREVFMCFYAKLPLMGLLLK